MVGTALPIRCSSGTVKAHIMHAPAALCLQDTAQKPDVRDVRPGRLEDLRANSVVTTLKHLNFEIAPAKQAPRLPRTPGRSCVLVHVRSYRQRPRVLG